jgi:hypothetical protein
MCIDHTMRQSPEKALYPANERSIRQNGLALTWDWAVFLAARPCIFLWEDSDARVGRAAWIFDAGG